MTHAFMKLSSIAAFVLVGACAVPPASVDDPQTSRGEHHMGYAHTLEAEFDALGHVGPNTLRWANLDTERIGLSCVDGREHEGVVGSPGGDAGELLLLLASAEAEGVSIDVDETAGFIDTWIAEFGGFYLHTDVDALAGLGRSLAADPRFHDELLALTGNDGDLDLVALEGWLRSPPLGLHEPLLAHLVDPDTVGCGHLRSVLRAPEDYDVRPALAGAVISGFYRRLWSNPEQMRFVVLQGHHQERAILDVEVDEIPEPNHEHDVPLVMPANAHDQVFVIQPQAIALFRERAVGLMAERHPELDTEALYARMHALGTDQLSATLHHPWIRKWFHFQPVQLQTPEPCTL